jgi:hypothetical protein
MIVRHEYRGRRASKEVSPSHGRVVSIDVGWSQSEKVRGDVQVTSQPAERAYVIDTGPAVLDPRDLGLVVSARVSCLALGLTFGAPGMAKHRARVPLPDSREHSR